MKISRKLLLGLTGQVFLIALVIFSLFYQSHKLQQVNQYTVDRIRENAEQLSLLSAEMNVPYEETAKSLSDESIHAIHAKLGRLSFSVTGTLVIFLAIIVALVFLTSSVSRGVNTIVKHLNYNLHRLAEGDLTVVTSGDLKKRKDEVGELSRSISKLKWNMRKVIGEISTEADSLAEAGRQISSSAQLLSQGSNRQAAGVEDICTTIEQITASIKQNARNSMDTGKISAEAQDDLELVNEKASRSLDATREIAGKIQIINDIAFLTNILALNAAVEAARAGEHGKGFAVVAAEVKKLAERSKQAAEQIIGLSKISYDMAEETGQRMAETLPKAIRTSRLVQEIAAASHEQEKGVNQVNTAIQQLNQVTQQNAAASEELATSSEQLSNQADHLRDLISFFEVDGDAQKGMPAPVRQMQSNETSRMPAMIKNDNEGEWQVF